MTKRTLLAFLAFAVSFACTVHAQDTPHDGFWWTGEPESFKLGYVAGYAEANGARDTIGFSQCVAAKNGGSFPDKPPGNAIIDECRTASDPQFVDSIPYFDYSQLRFRQLEEGLDEFYKDFRNKSIPVSEALPYVRDQLRGMSDGELAARLEQLRKTANKVNH